MLERDASLGCGCSFRLVQEGALLMLPYLGKRLLYASPAAVAALLRLGTVPLLPLEEAGETRGSGGDGSGAAQHPSTGSESNVTVDPSSDLRELVSWVASLETNGCCVIACSNCRGTARAAVCLMKYTEKVGHMPPP